MERPFVFDQAKADMQVLGEEGIRELDEQHAREMAQDVLNCPTIKYFKGRAVKIVLQGATQISGWVKETDYHGITLITDENPETKNPQLAFAFWDSVVAIQETKVEIKSRDCQACPSWSAKS
jgi:hypothetical protein